MNKSNVYSKATILKSDDDTQSFELGQFIGNKDNNNIEHSGNIQLNDKSINGNIDPVLLEVQALTTTLSQVQGQIADIQNDGVKGRDFDKQITQALKDLKNYASFFEQAIFQMESKILKTSISIARKIITIEVGENSSKIAKETILSILNQIKTAAKINIHLNPKDFLILKDELNLDTFITLQEDPNVAIGGVVIASDLGNFDGNIESKIQTLLEPLNTII